jgi:large conductance mechanosensitive channel
MRYLEEFKAFAIKGNVVDLAVGVIIGGAFGKIVTSLVNDIVMPLLAVLVAGVNFNELAWELQAAEGGRAAVVIRYGAFFQSMLDFLIIAGAIFVAVKIIAKMRFRAAVQEAASAPSEEVQLLTEIRDALAAKKQ